MGLGDFSFFIFFYFLLFFFLSYFLFEWGRGAGAKHLKDQHGEETIISVGCNNDGTVSGRSPVAANSATEIVLKFWENFISFNTVLISALF
jgi:hypothetical protein